MTSALSRGEQMLDMSSAINQDEGSAREDYSWREKEQIRKLH